MRNPYQRIIRGNVIQDGHIDTHKKFDQLLEGIDLRGKTFLDVGCNLGEMCYLASQRGASYIMGIDIDYTEEAREMNPDISFLNVPGEKARGNYDVVVASAMFHYITDHDKFLNQLARVANEVVSIDVWITEGSDLAFRLSTRDLFIPTKPAFEFLARKYFDEIKEAGKAISPDGSHRVIYHLSKPNPKPAEAVLIFGKSKTGKTTKARNMFDHDHLQLDQIFIEWRIFVEQSLEMSVSDFVDRSQDNEDYFEYHRKFIDKWLSFRINIDVVIEGYDMIYEKYRDMVKQILKEQKWKTKEIHL